MPDANANGAEDYADYLKNSKGVDMPEIEAMVSNNGEGDKVTLVIPPELRQWQHFDISPDEARLLAAKLTKAANLAASNHADDILEDELLAVKAERERCAKIAAAHQNHSGIEIAELIRDDDPLPHYWARSARLMAWILKHWYWCQACNWMDRQTNHPKPPERCPECLTPATGTTGLNGELGYAAAIAGSSVGPTTETSLVAALSR